MLKFITVLAATGVVVFGASTLAGAAGKTSKPTTPHRTQPAVTVVAVLGRRVNVPWHKFVMAYANCPKGYYVTGGGVYNGAINEVVSGPQPNMKGWYVDGTNGDQLKRTFFHAADAVCIKGSKTVSLATPASSPASIREAEAAYAQSHWGTQGG
jgi:hypothetical protein